MITYKRWPVFSRWNYSMSADKDAAIMKSIVKAFETLETLSQKPSWELADLCKHLAMPKTTVHRIVLTLEKLGYVGQEKRRGDYSLTSKLFKLGSSVINHSGLVDMARQECQRLLSEVQETVNLCVPNGTDMLVIDIQASHHPLRQVTSIGAGFAMIRSASGRAYLAFLKQPELDAILSQIREDIDNDAEWEGLLSELDETRRTGIGYDNEEIFTGVRCVAAPIFNHQSDVIGAVSVSAPKIRLDEKELEAAALAVSQATANISNRLGAPHLSIAGRAHKK